MTTDEKIVSLSDTVESRRVFKTRHFNRWMRKTELTDRMLCAAVQEMVAGLIDADLGAGVLKKRIGLVGRGKRGGVRTLVATNQGSRWFFVFGFEKNAQANVSRTEHEVLQTLGAELLMLSHSELDAAVREGSLVEICHDRKN